MKENMLWKAIALGIVFLFVGASTVSALNANSLDIEADKIVNDLRLKLDTLTTKEETIALFKEIIVKLNDYELLPKQMSVKQAQRLLNWCNLRSELNLPFQNKNAKNTGNSNCLVVGMTNNTFFRPYPTIYDIPIIHHLFFNTSFGNIFNFLIWFYAFRAFQPLKFGPFAYFGERYKLVENGNITYEHFGASSGWVWTKGTNGVKKWNGTFYGGLYTKYLKSGEDENNYAEVWQPVGIRGFVGINLFNDLPGGEIPNIYIGFAKEVNLTYSPPWI